MRIAEALAPALIGLAAAAVATGCAGGARKTTTPRSAEEQLLVSTAAERAVARIDARRLAGRTVFVDESRLDAIDRGYILSAFRELCASARARLVNRLDAADVVVEVRAAAATAADNHYVLRAPVVLVIGVAPSGAPTGAPEWVEVGRVLHEGWVRVQAFAYERRTGAFAFGWRDGWGRARRDLVGTDIYPDAGIAGALRERVE